MKKWPFLFGLLILITMAFRLAGCDSGQYGESASEPKVEKGAVPTAKMAAMPGTAKGEESALIVEEGVAGGTENNEGVNHYKAGHWDVARDYFQKSLYVNADLAEAHFNLALALDKMGEHGEAANHFRMALNLGKENPKINGSAILMAHVKG